MPRVPRISDSEWKVMRVVWAATTPVAAYDVIETLRTREKWKPKTIRSLLARLVSKGALGYLKYKNLYLYYALVSEDAYVRAEAASFLRRCFGGALQPMVAYFVQQRSLTRAEVTELKRILDEGKERK